MADERAWRWPTGVAHETAAATADLVFVGGAGPYGADGTVQAPGDIEAQIDRAMANVGRALAGQGCSLDDVVRLKAFYRGADEGDHWRLTARLRGFFAGEAAPAITANPVVLSPYPGQEIQLQAIAARGWREAANLDLVTAPVPDRFRGLFETPLLTQGLRSGELIVVAGQTAIDADGRALAPGDGPAQTRIVMSRAGEILARLGAGFQDCVKKEGYYFGNTLEEWAVMAEIRASYFRDPAAVATVVPCQLLFPEGLVTKVEFIARRTAANKYIPRADSWPAENWDWPIPVPYRQGIKLGGAIWVGGQVAFAPGSRDGTTVHAGDVIAQTGVAMGYIEGILGGFGAGTGAIRLLVCYFASDGSAGATEDFLAALADRFDGPLPPLTVVPLPRLHDDAMTVEIWAVAAA